jgi:cell division protein FtsB
MPTREELETRKLELEVRDLARPPWMRAVYIAALLPVVLALLTFLSAWLSGYFDAERLRLKQETQQLRADRDGLKTESRALHASVDLLVDMVHKMTQAINEDNKLFDRIKKAPTPIPTGTPSSTSPPQPDGSISPPTETGF